MNKARVLAVLYNNAKSGGRGIKHVKAHIMTQDEAQELLDTGKLKFDYLHGRLLKINLSRDEMETTWYNLHNGENAAEIALDVLLY